MSDLSVEFRFVDGDAKRSIKSLKEEIKGITKAFENAEIAERIVVCLSTVKYHVSNILAKLGVANRVAAIALAIQEKMI